MAQFFIHITLFLVFSSVADRPEHVEVSGTKDMHFIHAHQNLTAGHGGQVTSAEEEVAGQTADEACSGKCCITMVKTMEKLKAKKTRVLHADLKDWLKVGIGELRKDKCVGMVPRDNVNQALELVLDETSEATKWDVKSIDFVEGTSLKVINVQILTRSEEDDEQQQTLLIWWSHNAPDRVTLEWAGANIETKLTALGKVTAKGKKTKKTAARRATAAAGKVTGLPGWMADKARKAKSWRTVAPSAVEEGPKAGGGKGTEGKGVAVGEEGAGTASASGQVEGRGSA